MEEILYYTVLFDIYGGLLTKKQQQYFKEYYFENLSLQEIADNYNVSRNAIYNQLRETKDLLNHYEEILNDKKKQEKLEEALSFHKIEEIKNKIKEILEM